MAGRYLIVGLGNPGRAYLRTRHNIGFEVVDFLAQKAGLEFKKKLKMKGSLAEGVIAGESCILLKPLTYMNLSGEAVSAVRSYYQVDLLNILVVVDDVDLPLGRLRLKVDSGPGTHNGLKSVEESLKTNRYARLKFGVGDRIEGDLSSHVLGKFTSEEEKMVPSLVEEAAKAVELYIEKGLTRAMEYASRVRGSSIDSKQGNCE